MNIAQAKQISLDQFLARLGHAPVRRQRGQLWYLSPLRQEKTPSFKINTERNLWFDFGLGQGGSIIDLAAHLGNTRSVADALRWIDQTMGGAPFVREAPSLLPSRPRAAGLSLFDQRPVRSHILKTYLAKRGVHLSQVAHEIREVHYESAGGSFIAIGFANDLGGFELRSESFQGTLGAKALSTRKGDTDTVLVFEGFFDYLSYVACHGVTSHGRPKDSVIVLNSVALRDRAVAQLKSLAARRIEVYRDNDAAGASLLNYFQEQLPDIEILDQARLYSPYNDFNEWHVAQVDRRIGGAASRG